ERIAATRPRRVLEIGCGTGLLLLRLAPRGEGYVGTDFSPVALRYVEEQLARLGRLGDAAARVTLLERPADDLTGLADEGFDTVILNSVVQYFPDAGYLVAVLEKAVAALAPGGVVFLGDLRSFPLLEAFHTSVELFRAPASLAAAAVAARACRQMAREQELCLDPAFFTRLRQLVPRI